MYLYDTNRGYPRNPGTFQNSTPNSQIYCDIPTIIHIIAVVYSVLYNWSDTYGMYEACIQPCDLLSRNRYTIHRDSARAWRGGAGTGSGGGDFTKLLCDRKVSWMAKIDQDQESPGYNNTLFWSSRQNLRIKLNPNSDCKFATLKAASILQRCFELSYMSIPTRM